MSPKNTPNNVEQVLLNIKEASRMLSLSRSSIYNRLKDDPSFPRPRRIGKLTRFMRNELVEWAESQPIAN